MTGDKRGWAVTGRDRRVPFHAHRVLEMPRTFIDAMVFAAVCCWCAAVGANEVSRSEMRSLDEQVQEVKSDVLGIAAELNQLEEQLLFPSNTQVTVFVELGDGDTLRLDSVQLGIDDQLATHHIYSFKELEALQQGGVQRLFMGNLPRGTHELEVSVLGKLSNGNDFSHAERFTFQKGVNPALIGITLDPDSVNAPIALQDW